MTVQNLRRDYRYGSLERSHLPNDPIDLFHQWFDELRALELPEWFEVNAMSVATRGLDGGACCRILLLKEIEPDGFLFFTNYLSDKAKQIEADNRVSLSFHWPMLERQVRIEGLAEKTDAAHSDRYFESRPRSSQLGANVSPQSAVIHDDSSLAQAVEALDCKLDGKPVPRPENWGGYRVRPLLIEFWQGRPSRLHDRFRYLRTPNGDWQIDRLAP